MSTAPSCLAIGDKGPALLFLHGIGGDAECFRPQLAHFGREFRAIAWNMPGYAGTPLLPQTTFPTLADAVAALLDARGIAQVHLVGHSLGGMIAQEFAARHPGSLASLTLSGTTAAFGRPDGAFQRDFIRQRLAPLEAGQAMADLAARLVGGLIGPAPDPAGMAIALASMGRVKPETYRAALECLVDFDRRDALPHIAVPTLLIAGGADTTAPAAVMERMAAKIPGARFVTMPGAGHLANLEQPVGFNRVLEQFLREIAHG
ncbi:MAG TPA: alpha/beta fold hydrolase [Stellaceae bacterium]|nr:alpha/beta fold hydrolase [Stellaceae bacterium]